MKKHSGIQLSLLIILGTMGLVLKTQAQNSGIGTTTPASKLHIVGSGNTSSTSSLQVQNSTNPTPLLFVRDDGKVGIGTNSPSGILDVNGWQYLRDAGGYPMIMCVGNSYATKNLGMHFDGYGTSSTAPSYEFRLGRYNKSNDLWEANSLRFSMLAPDGSLMMDATGNFGVGMGTAMPAYRFQVRGPNDPGQIQAGRVANFTDYSGNYQTYFTQNTCNSCWNPLTKATDNGIFWKDDEAVEALNGFVIAPHSSVTKGMRIDGQTGNVEVGGNSYRAVLGGLAASTNLGYGTSYLGFNLARSTYQANTWTTGTDAYNNGGGVIYGDMAGGIRIATLSSVPGTPGSTAGQTGITDATIAGNTKMYIRQDGNVGIGTISPATNAKLAIKDGHIQTQQTTAIPNGNISVTGGASGTFTGMGTSPTDIAGKISITTPAAASTVTVTFSKVYATAPVVVITPTSANAAADMAKTFVTSTTTSFTINFAASPAANTKTFNYMVVETQ